MFAVTLKLHTALIKMMVMTIKDVMARIQKLKIAVSLALVLIMLANIVLIRSSILGAITFILFFVTVGCYLGEAFFIDEEETITRIMFGIFLLICLLILLATPVLIFYELNPWSLGVVFIAPPVLAATYLKFKKKNLGKNRKRTEIADKVRYFSLMYGVFLVLISYCVFLLATARSGWVNGTVWDVVSPYFFTAYFLAAFVLIIIILYCRTAALSKMLLVLLYSLISTMIFAIVLYPGNHGDPFSHMASARTMVNYGSLTKGYALSPWLVYWLLKEKALALLTAVVAKMFMIDVYWVHTFILPVLWGVFVPFAAYKIMKTLGVGEKVSVLAAFLTTFYSNFIGWGSRSTGNSFGFVLFIVSLYLSLKYLKSDANKRTFALAALTASASWLVHPLTGTMSFAFLFLAAGLKRYELIESPRRAYLLMCISFVGVILILPALFLLNNFIYIHFAPGLAQEAGTAWSLEKLVNTDIWELIFGEYVNFTFKEVIKWGALPFMGFIGLICALKEKIRYIDSRILRLFVLLALVICVIDYMILKYAMINVLFTPSRVWVFRDFIAVPFAAITISLLIGFFEGSPLKKPKTLALRFSKWVVKLPTRRIFAGVLVSLSLSAFAVYSIYESYSWLRGLQPTALEIEAAKYIDEHTDGRYIVLSNPATMMVGRGFIGQGVPEKYYARSPTLPPTVMDMIQYMETYQAETGYFIASSFYTPEAAIEKAFHMYGLLKILSNEYAQIYIFKYEIPPLPSGPDVMAFYWDTPPSYFIQNELMRVVFNPESKRLDVVDFWGDLYEEIDLNRTLVDGKPLGKLMSVEYLDSSINTWLNWSTNEEILPASRFEFKIRFENESLLGAFERDKASVQLRWEGSRESTLSLNMGSFTRLFIPGLVEGINSYDVISREFGFLYTVSRTENVMLHPAYKYDINSPTLTFGQIQEHSDLTIGQGYVTYDVYVDNNAQFDQWAFIEVWIPDKIHMGIVPPLSYSLDNGTTWINAAGEIKPITTIDGTEVNWVITKPGKAGEKPIAWRWYTKEAGGSFPLPESLSDSGGAQNRLLFGLFLPARNKVLLRLAFSVYYLHPLEVTYVFTDSDNPHYGLRNMNDDLIALYNYGSGVYAGGITSTMQPSSLAITQDETGNIESLSISFPPDAIFSLLSAKGADTTTDLNGNGVPDFVEGMQR